jgi:hypothetical protein
MLYLLLICYAHFHISIYTERHDEDLGHHAQKRTLLGRIWLTLATIKNAPPLPPKNTYAFHAALPQLRHHYSLPTAYDATRYQVPYILHLI